MNGLLFATLTNYSDMRILFIQPYTIKVVSLKCVCMFSKISYTARLIAKQSLGLAQDKY